ncbi:phage antirepressor [Clostridium tetani]|uniref:phage antirepressor n=1 Tax=Clostridium tetani TaxID=1513 RepID=UPI00100A6F17|nr:phage antirepressor KilAC domain-containing protein [Clostridium tetani]RXM72693.1 phage antirepressor protein [Clostridium tetani]
MNNLQIFNNKDFGEVRTIIKENGIWFVGKDVAECLGYSNSSKAVSTHVDNEDRVLEMVAHSQNGNMVKTQTSLINESGLYSLVLSSKLPSAKKFKRWVTSEVLPSIRKHGMYAKDELLDNPDLLIQVATKLKEEKAKNKMLELQNKQKEQIIGELKPRADYTDRILKNKGLVTITQIAKDYGMTGTGLNKLLHELKVQYKQSDQWLLYKEHSGKGYTHSETIDIVRSDGRPDVKMNTKWTQKGRLFLYNLLRDNGILPTIEQEAEREVACN